MYPKHQNDSTFKIRDDGDTCMFVFAHAKKLGDRGHACTFQGIRIRSLHSAKNRLDCFYISNYSSSNYREVDIILKTPKYLFSILSSRH